MEAALVVVLIVIAAAISWNMYRTHLNNDASVRVQETLPRLAFAVEKYAADNTGIYSGIDDLSASELEEFGYKADPDVAIQFESMEEDSYCLKATFREPYGGKWEVATFNSEVGVAKSSDGC